MFFSFCYDTDTGISNSMFHVKQNEHWHFGSCHVYDNFQQVIPHFGADNNAIVAAHKTTKCKRTITHFCTNPTATVINNLRILSFIYRMKFVKYMSSCICYPPLLF